MIRKILTYYAERLEEYLSRTHRRPEGLATVANSCKHDLPLRSPYAFFDRLENKRDERRRIFR